MYVFSVCQALDRCRALNLLNAVLQLSSLFVRTVLLIVLHFVSVVVFTLFVMFSCAPDPFRICQVILTRVAFVKLFCHLLFVFVQNHFCAQLQV